MTNTKRDNKKPKKIGILVKMSSDKTISVLTETRVTHPKYKKIIKKSKKYLVHFESSDKLTIGDKIEFMSCRPISKSKKWTYVQKIEG
tara:strand:- start:397 stop:660 length:264 start_codon:yes stop_codon:yes gene_type:complete